MDTPRKQHITLQLDAHHVSMQVVPEQEHLYRRAAESLNELYRAYVRKMPQASAEELWCYVALHIAVNFQADAFTKRLEPIDAQLNALSDQILHTLHTLTNH